MEGQGGHENNEDQVPPSPREIRTVDFVKLREERSALAALQAKQEQRGQAPELDENGEDKIAVRISALKAEIGAMRSPPNREAYQNSQREYAQQPEIRRRTKQEAERAKIERDKGNTPRREISNQRRKLSIPNKKPALIPTAQPA